MVRTYAVIALFLARMIVAVFELGSADPAALKTDVVADRQPAVVEAQPIVVSGLPEYAGTQRR